MIVPRTIVASYFVLVSLLAACAGRHNPAPGDEADAPQTASGPVTLEVQNHNWSDIVLFIIHDGRTNRFAQIAAARDESFEIPSRYLGDQGTIRLGLHRVGGRDDYSTEPVSVRTGNTIRLTIEGRLDHSSIGVW